MKFTHQLKFNSVPEWREHYVQYAHLKKYIYALAKREADAQKYGAPHGDEEGLQQALLPGGQQVCVAVGGECPGGRGGRLTWPKGRHIYVRGASARCVCAAARPLPPPGTSTPHQEPANWVARSPGRDGTAGPRPRREPSPCDPFRWRRSTCVCVCVRQSILPQGPTEEGFQRELDAQLAETLRFFSVKEDDILSKLAALQHEIDRCRQGGCRASATSSGMCLRAPGGAPPTHTPCHASAQPSPPLIPTIRRH